MPRMMRPKDIESYTHQGEERVNNPPVGLVTPRTEPRAEQKTTYSHDPHVDPEMSWAGKSEHTAFEVPTVSLDVHERIDPRTIIEAALKNSRGGGGGGSSPCAPSLKRIRRFGGRSNSTAIGTIGPTG